MSTDLRSDIITILAYDHKTTHEQLRLIRERCLNNEKVVWQLTERDIDEAVRYALGIEEAPPKEVLKDAIEAVEEHLDEWPEALERINLQA